MSEDAPKYGTPKPTLAELVAAEREKQRAKGYDAKHDDLFVNGELAYAAACYVAGDVVRGSWEETEDVWPWEGSVEDAIEGKDRPQQIVIAIALLEAEYERLMRAT